VGHGKYLRLCDPVDRSSDASKNRIFRLKGNPNHTVLNLPKLEESEGYQARRALADFDVRTAFPNCTVLSKIRDQSACGSCWAFGSTETFEGRRCIAQLGDIEYSADDTAGCATYVRAMGFASCACAVLGRRAQFCRSAGMGCDGGQPDSALEWISTTGIVTGGDYADVGTGTSCKPYEFKACAHHVPPSAKYPACPSAEYSIKCHKACDTKYNKTYTADKVKGGKVHSISSVSGIVTALAKGPVSVRPAHSVRRRR
jgi:cathepsin B